MFVIYAYGMVNNMEMTWEECQKQYDKLCWKTVNKYKNLKLEPDERYNLALFGLWKAYESYDETNEEWKNEKVLLMSSIFTTKCCLYKNRVKCY